MAGGASIDPAAPGTALDLAVELRSIRKRFGFREVLRGVHLEVSRGESVAIFGPNGAGKSTLLRIIATVWRASAGRGSVLGFDLARERVAIRQRIGVVFHQSFLRRELTLEENLRLYCGLFDAKFDARVEESIERFGLEKRRRDPVGAFSQGMEKRANLIRSLLHRPEIWILDEPFSGLDPEGRQVLKEAIASFSEAGGTVLLVTHQTELGEELCTRRVRLLGGEVVSDEGRTLPAEPQRP